MISALNWSLIIILQQNEPCKRVFTFNGQSIQNLEQSTYLDIIVSVSCCLEDA